MEKENRSSGVDVKDEEGWGDFFGSSQDAALLEHMDQVEEELTKKPEDLSPKVEDAALVGSSSRSKVSANDCPVDQVKNLPRVFAL
jgi:hypothetical protein